MTQTCPPPHGCTCIAGMKERPLLSSFDTRSARQGSVQNRNPVLTCALAATCGETWNLPSLRLFSPPRRRRRRLLSCRFLRPPCFLRSSSSSPTVCRAANSSDAVSEYAWWGCPHAYTDICCMHSDVYRDDSTITAKGEGDGDAGAQFPTLATITFSVPPSQLRALPPCVSV